MVAPILPDMATMKPNTSPRILFIDAYDSFANNIVALLHDAIGAEVVTIYIDDPRFNHEDNHGFIRFLGSFDAVVAGPGPGTVTNSEDVGLIARLWNLPEEHLLPVFGICLGFQSLSYAFGATIGRLSEPRHGIITKVHHRSRSVFKDVKEVYATQYHSLQVHIGLSDAEKCKLADPQQLWRPTSQCPELKPLAWDCDSVENGSVLMAIQHISKPFWGVQYHPESICTNLEGSRIIRNWWAEAQTWLSARGSKTSSSIATGQAHIKSFRHQGDDESCKDGEEFFNTQHIADDLPISNAWDNIHRLLLDRGLVNKPSIEHPEPAASWTCINSSMDTSEISELLHLPGNQAIVLESGLNATKKPIRAETGSSTVIGLFDEQNGTLRLEHYIEGQVLELWVGNELLHRQPGIDFWAFVRDFMGRYRLPNKPGKSGPSKSPFWGGLMGFVSYEAGLETINVEAPIAPQTGTKRRQPDIAFAYIMRSIIINHVENLTYVQSLRDDDQHWIEETSSRLSSGRPSKTPPPTTASSAALTTLLRHSHLTLPARQTYESKVLACQESIRAGDSYEMCLTSQTRVLLPLSPHSASTPWLLYKRLRKLNPAPFGAYLRFGGAGRAVNVVSSSPERFLNWTREGVCQYRPIKGTVKKAAGITRSDAERILNSSKERAENLMIVDLVRHDLHGVVGAGNVRVRKLMGVEEYETVWQLVSVIEGDLTGSWASQHRPSSAAQTPSSAPSAASPASATPTSAPATSQPGIRVLAASLPPGSMTGAPKKRSCALLTAVEERIPRGVYSGVLGYLDVGGGGDFSVVIRTAVRWDGDVDVVDEVADDGKERKREYEIWRVGAGGAVTAQSTPEGEYEEMVAKLESTLRVFDADVVVDVDE